MSEEKVTLSETKADQDEQAPAEAKRTGLYGIAIIVAVVLALGIMYLLGAFSGEDEGATGTEAANADPSSLVASVNGITITRGELDEKKKQLQSAAPAGSADPTQDASFELQLLNEIINVKLLTSVAEQKGITVADADVDGEIANLQQVLGSEAALNDQLVAAGLTRDQLRVNMRNELLIRKLVDAETDIENISATDAEIKAAYDEAVKGALPGQEVPPLESVLELVKAQVVQEKTATIVDAYIEKLRGSATIDILL